MPCLTPIFDDPGKEAVHQEILFPNELQPLTEGSSALHAKKILILITEDWFAVSHFLPLIETLVATNSEVVVATRCSGRAKEIESLGAKVIPFDFRRSSLNPLEQVGTIRKLGKLITSQEPDVIHVIAMQPMVLASMAARLTVRKPFMMHLTGLGFLGISSGAAARLIRPAAMAALNGILSRPNSWLIAENPDDHKFLVDNGVAVGDRVTIVPGAGIDENDFPPYKPRVGTPLTAAFVGRMIRSKGVEVLVDAARLVKEHGQDLAISLYGRSDVDNPEAIPEQQLRAWQAEGLVTWHGHVSDVAGIWKASDICVLPSTSREGMPRSVLEAAASQRPLIVTDVPGSRHFVRDGVEGLVVSPNNAKALADALVRLIQDTDLRIAMGDAARARLVAGFTVKHVKNGILDAYAGLDASVDQQ
ncbi:MAG: glycosyltransferase family 4 protein [Pseudomonadota bacterium]